MRYPIVEELGEWEEYMNHHRKRYSNGTIQEYKRLLEGLKDESNLLHFFNQNRIRNKPFAYKCYIQFLISTNRLPYEEGLQIHALLTKQTPSINQFRQIGLPPIGRAIPEDEWWNIINQIVPNPYKMALWLGFSFGFRVGELTHLRIQDVEFTKQIIHVQAHKQDLSNNQVEWRPKRGYRTVVFTKEQKKVLQRWIQKERPSLPHPYLLYSQRHKTRLSERTLQRICQKNNFLTHDMRRTAINNWLTNGKSQRFVMLQVGHKDPMTTARYFRITPEEMLREAEG